MKNIYCYVNLLFQNKLHKKINYNFILKFIDLKVKTCYLKKTQLNFEIKLSQNISKQITNQKI